MIYFLGDVHGSMAHVLPAILKQRDPMASVVFLGDIEASEPFESQIQPLLDAKIGVWFIHGNHDTDHQANWCHLQGSQRRNLDGRVVEIEAVRVAGLGGVFRGEIWYPDHLATGRHGLLQHKNMDEYIRWLKGKTPPRLHDSVKYSGRVLKHRSSIFPDTYDKLADLRADILVTHEAPSCHPNGFQSLDVLAQVMGVKAMFHGHHHDCLDYSVAEPQFGFRVHGVGFRGITDQNGRKAAPGYFDGARHNHK